MVRRLFFVNLILAGQRASGLDSSTSPSMARLTPGLSSFTSTWMARFTPGLYASVCWAWFVDSSSTQTSLTSMSTASVQLDFVSSTHRRRPACSWSSSRRLLVNGQCATGLPSSTSTSTASVPLVFHRRLPRQRPVCRAGLVLSVDIIVDGQSPCWTFNIYRRHRRRRSLHGSSSSNITKLIV